MNRIHARRAAFSKINCRLAGSFVAILIMPLARITVIDKQRLLNAYERGDDYFALADDLGIKRRSAYAIVRRVERRGGVVELPRGGRRHVKVDNDMRRELEKLSTRTQPLCSCK